MSDETEIRFDEAMMDVYRRALKECGYNATRFLPMLYEHRGLETARILLRASRVSEAISRSGNESGWTLRLRPSFSLRNGRPFSPIRSAQSCGRVSRNMAIRQAHDE